MKNIKFPSVSLVITVLNETESIRALLNSIDAQTYQPKEIIIVDGGSTDDTLHKLHAWAVDSQARVISHTGNISQSRNYGIKQARCEWIACTDAGCILQEDWLEMLVRRTEKSVDIVAGFYLGNPDSAFEEAVVPFVLVQDDQLDIHTFLPATRSLLMRKKVWEDLEGFREDLQVSEDYVFTLLAQDSGYTIVCEPNALVRWKPRKNWLAFFKMVHDQAYNDQKAGVRRKKVKYIFYRYLLGLSIVIFTQSLVIVTIGISIYAAYSIWKHRNHLPKRGWYFLPFLQILSDIAVMLGTTRAQLAGDRS